MHEQHRLHGMQGVSAECYLEGIECDIEVLCHACGSRYELMWTDIRAGTVMAISVVV